MIMVRGTAWDCPHTPLLADENSKDEPGQDVVLDRLLDLLLIAALRAWFSRPEAAAPPGTDRAADLLRDSGLMIGSIARKVGTAARSRSPAPSRGSTESAPRSTASARA